MNDAEYKFKLSQIGRWYIPIVSDAQIKPRKPLPGTEPNQHMGPVLAEVYSCLKPCEWCQEIVDQRQNHTLRFTSIDGKRSKRRWEHSCQNCKKVFDAKSGQVKEKRVHAKKLPCAKIEPAKREKKIYWWNEESVVYVYSDENKLG